MDVVDVFVCFSPKTSTQVSQPHQRSLYIQWSQHVRMSRKLGANIFHQKTHRPCYRRLPFRSLASSLGIVRLAGLILEAAQTAYGSRLMYRLKVEQKVDARVLDEVQGIIELPSEAADICKDPESVELPPGVIEQLTDYVSKIAGMYHENSFHHASHVTQSVVKLLSRVVTSSITD